MERESVIKKLTNINKIPVPSIWGNDPHYWFLLVRQYWEERKNQSQYAGLFESKINRDNLAGLRRIAVQKAVSSAAAFASKEKEAATDPLTGVFNRRALDKYLSNLLSQPRRDSTNAVIMLDIDNFKHFNDTYGHPFGDKVLQELVKIIRENTRGIDFLSRYAGDEFVLIIPGLDTTKIEWQKKIMTIVNNLRERIEQNLKNKVNCNNKPLDEDISTSIGVCFLNEQKFIDINQVYSLADNRLYQAKNEGKNRVIGLQ